MVNTPAIANLIRENKVEQIKNVIQTSARLGMQSYSQELRKLVKDGMISEETSQMYALTASDDPTR
jgi:twitching motility protein PilT